MKLNVEINLIHFYKEKRIATVLIVSHEVCFCSPAYVLKRFPALWSSLTDLCLSVCLCLSETSLFISPSCPKTYCADQAGLCRLSAGPKGMYRHTHLLFKQQLRVPGSVAMLIGHPIKL